jgi:hypothetical protein
VTPCVAEVAQQQPRQALQRYQRKQPQREPLGTLEFLAGSGPSSPLRRYAAGPLSQPNISSSDISSVVSPASPATDPRADYVKVVEMLDSCCNDNALKFSPAEAYPTTQDCSLQLCLPASVSDVAAPPMLYPSVQNVDGMAHFPIPSPTDCSDVQFFNSPKQTIHMQSLTSATSPSWTSENSCASTRTSSSGSQLRNVGELHSVLNPKVELDWTLLDLSDPAEDSPLSPAISDVTIKDAEARLLTSDDVDELLEFALQREVSTRGPVYPALHANGSGIGLGFR